VAPEEGKGARDRWACRATRGVVKSTRGVSSPAPSDPPWALPPTGPRAGPSSPTTTGHSEGPTGGSTMPPTTAQRGVHGRVHHSPRHRVQRGVHWRVHHAPHHHRVQRGGHGRVHHTQGHRRGNCSGTAARPWSTADAPRSHAYLICETNNRKKKMQRSGSRGV
jgi:hypothetical protein